MPGGYARVLERFEDLLRKEGVDVRLGQPTKSVRRSGAGLDVETAEGAEAFDRVVLTVPAVVAARVCEGLAPDEKARLEGVAYQGIICASLLLRRPLAGFYVTNITDPWVPFTGVIEMSALVDPSQLGGHSLVYLPKYVDPADPAFEKSDAEIQELFVSALERMYPGFGRGDLVSFRVSRVRHVFALPTLGYSLKLPAMDTTVPGLHVINSAHIVNGTLNVNETVQLAEREARRLLARD